MNRGNIKLLIVDDDASNRELIKELLNQSKNFSFHFIESGSAKETLKLFSEKSFDCILIAYQLPDMNILEFLQEIYEGLPFLSTPIIVLTHNGNDEDNITFLKSGAYDFLSKHNLTLNLLEKSIINSIRWNQVEMQLHKNEQNLRFLVSYDPLTELLNRSTFEKELKKALTESNSQAHQKFALFFLDLNKFKSINEKLGHTVGDRVLQAVSRRICHGIRKEDCAGRLGDDTFGILIRNINTMEGIQTKAQNLCNHLAEPFKIQEHEIHISVSLGIVLFSEEETDPSKLLSQADTAMREVKKTGKTGYYFFGNSLL